MPCNDNQSVCNEGATGVFDSSAVPSSSSSATLRDERLVSITTENGHTFPQSSYAELKNTTVRTRTASSRSTSNLHSMYFLPGEDIDSDNFVDMESCQLYVTQFRIIIVAHNQSAICAIPLTGVDLLEAKDIVGLQISSKDGKIIKFVFLFIFKISSSSSIIPFPSKFFLYRICTEGSDFFLFSSHLPF
ncbi:unnamed protein product [Meloidogyne enterolobii]|uniref:Uncharacterized protein n=2 Tax=Meloidogyne enterolobii TaxID=390850 RepID=A0ACB0ZEZ2_MELEN